MNPAVDAAFYNYAKFVVSFCVQCNISQVQAVNRRVDEDFADENLS